MPSGNGPQSKVALVATFDHNDYAYATKERSAVRDPAGTDGWSIVSFWYLTPEVRKPTDRLLIYAQLAEGRATLVDELEVTLYEPLN